MRSGTTAKAFVFPEGSAAPKGLLYDEILIKYLIETARQSLKTRKLRHSTNLSLQKNQTLNQSQKKQTQYSIKQEDTLKIKPHLDK